MSDILLLFLILGPVVFAVLAFLAPGHRSRSLFVTLGAITTAAAGIGTLMGGPFRITLGPWGEPASLVLEFGIVLVVLFIAYRIRSLAIFLLAGLQLLLLIWERTLPPRGMGGGADFILDPLSLILVLVITLVGSVIVFFAIGYMKQHEEHAPATAASNGRFFFFLVGFLGMMDGLVLADNLTWLSFFWEATTLCSFMLIGHDGTEIARRNAKRALLINTFGGLAMTLGSVLTLALWGEESLTGIMATRAVVPMVLLALAALTKSAQMPFQSWLLGAMVAPTPVSALLHSATMVKAGSYLILRLAPAFAGEPVMSVIAIAGAFTFALAAALAIGQSNAKKVLAYSTISNLGLIVACAGINTPLAYSAALMILCFHAISKGLLFLCVGTIEQRIGSRDIEDMGDILFLMPMTTICAVIGMVSMLLPPFGMLMSKWMAMEAAIHSPTVLFLLIIGSALTVVFWAKWIGRIQTVDYRKEGLSKEALPFTIAFSNAILAFLVFFGGLLAMDVHKLLFDPLAAMLYQAVPLSPSSWRLLESVGEFTIWPLVTFMALAGLAWLFTTRRLDERRVRLPFLCGENVPDAEKPYQFRGPMDLPEEAWAATFYLRSVFDEDRVTFWANLCAVVIVVVMLGVVGLL